MSDLYTKTVDEEEVIEPPKPPRGPKRRYGTQTGSQFFTANWMTDYSSFINPYTNDNKYDLNTIRQMYGDMPVVSGYWETPGEYDAEGNWVEGDEGAFVPTTSLYNQAKLMYELRNMDQVPDWKTWLIDSGFNWTNKVVDSIGEGPYKGITTLLDDINVEEEMIDAERRAALTLGFLTTDDDGKTIGDLETFRKWKELQQEEIDLGPTGQTGLTPEMEETYRRANSARINLIINENKKMLESLGLQSNAAAFSKMGEISDMVAHEQLQFEMKLMEQDQMMQVIEYEALLSRYKMFTDIESNEKSMYLDAITQNRMTALQAYSIQLDSIFRENEQTMMQYGMELDKLRTHADITYKTLMAQIGYDEHLMNMLESEYELYMTPYIDELEQWAFEREQRRQDEEDARNDIRWQWELEDRTTEDDEKDDITAGKAALWSAIITVAGQLIVTVLGHLFGKGKENSE